MLTTTNYKFKKPELTDSPPDITVMNGNWDIIDTNLKKLNDDKAPKDVATTSKEGLMSRTDKSKLDGIAQGANAYTHPSKHPASIITEDATHRFLTDAERKLIQAWEKFKASGGEIGGTDGTKLKIDGRTITAIGEALALIGEGTSPLYYARNRTHNVDQLIPGGKGELGSDEARWQEIYLGNYSKNANGYTKLPNGMILQWLYAGGSISQGKGVIEGNLPITFPNNYLSIFANVTYIDNDSTYNNLFNCNAKFVNKGYFNVNIKNLESNSGSFANCYVLAIGY